MIEREETLLIQRARRIRLLLLDVDGVLTDGTIIYDDNGIETKMFHVKDGMGIRLLQIGNIEVGIATGRTSGALVHRCRNLGITRIFQGLKNKTVVLETIRNDLGLVEDQIAFVGDDLVDIGIMKRVGLAIAVADAHEAVIDVSHMVCRAPGGHGAVREVAEYILKAQDQWPDILKRFSE